MTLLDRRIESIFAASELHSAGVAVVSGGKVRLDRTYGRVRAPCRARNAAR